MQIDDIMMSSISETAAYMYIYASQDWPSGTGCRENCLQDQQRREEEKIKLKDVELEDVHSFVYLGSIITSDGVADKDVKSRIGKARQALKIS